MGKQGDSTTSRTSTSHSRASRSPSRHIKNESPCTWLCVVANMDRELEDAVSSANYTRRPQQKHLSTHGSGLVNLGQECILIIQGLTKVTCI